MSTNRTIRGGTTLYGKLLAMGPGRGTLDLPAAGTIDIGVPPDVVPAMVDRLGTIVGVEGMATWDVDTLAVVGFSVSRLTKYNPDAMTLTEAFDALHEASGGAFDGMDVEAFMREMRGD